MNIDFEKLRASTANEEAKGFLEMALRVFEAKPEAFGRSPKEILAELSDLSRGFAEFTASLPEKEERRGAE